MFIESAPRADSYSPLCGTEKRTKERSGQAWKAWLKAAPGVSRPD